MKKTMMNADGNYLVGGRKGKKGRKFSMLIGSRAQVMHGTAYKTGAGKVKSKGGKALTKADLKYNKSGKIVSKAKSKNKSKLLAQLRRAGYTYKKGKFGAVKVGKKNKTRKKTRKKKR
tara:strand:- start:9511 stop:9864 length:354 start_codon:yes stop_codon:yes gene_type:complete